MKIEQGSEEWLNLRKGKITASKLPIIMGISPYQTPLELFEEELGYRPPQTVKKHMEDGLASENAARTYFYEKMGIQANPDVVFSEENPIFMASLDGISEDRQLILEIKKNNVDFHEMARSGSVVDFHQCQMQAQMYCTGLSMCHYLSYRKGDEIIVVVPRDDMFIEKMVSAGLDFKRRLDDLDAPELTDRDYEDLSADPELHSLVRSYQFNAEQSKLFKDNEERLKKEILDHIGNKSAKGMGWKMTKFKTTGRIDYDTILSQHFPDIDLSQYRKPSTTSYRITVDA